MTSESDICKGKNANNQHTYVTDDHVAIIPCGGRGCSYVQVGKRRQSLVVVVAQSPARTTGTT